MAIKIGINGFGRIGRLVFKAAMADGGFEVVGINDITDAKTLAICSSMTPPRDYPGEVKAEGDAIVVDGKKFPVMAEKDPGRCRGNSVPISWSSTGMFASAEALKKHQAGAKKVLLTVPPKDKIGE